MAQAKSGDTVKVNYTGKLDDGYVFDTSANRNPLKLKIGQKRLIPALEQAVIGMEQGKSKTVKIPAKEAFGRYREGLIQTVSRSVFPADLEPKVGQRLTATSVDGRSVAVTVTDISESSVMIGANHPLAGEDLEPIPITRSIAAGCKARCLRCRPKTFSTWRKPRLRAFLACRLGLELFARPHNDPVIRISS